MNKTDFLEALKKGLKDYSPNEIAQYTDYYSEMIDDRIEEGLSEEEAVADVGTPEAAVAQIKTENPITNRKRERVPLKTWQIVLIAVGSPIWLSLLIAFASIIFSLIAGILSALVSLYSVCLAISASSVACIISPIIFIINKNYLAAVFFFGLGLLLAALAIYSFIGLRSLTKLLTKGCKNLILWIKKLFTRKEELK